jgi:hypothetical protein
MLSLIARLSEGRISSWPEQLNIHSLTGILKRYLRKMAERNPLIPPAFYDGIRSTVTAKEPRQNIDHKMVRRQFAHRENTNLSLAKVQKQGFV